MLFDLFLGVNTHNLPKLDKALKNLQAQIKTVEPKLPQKPEIVPNFPFV